jgi:predicted ATPase
VGLLQARLDALPASERQAARQASVIGHVFWDDALQALDAQAPQALPALQRAAFVRTTTAATSKARPSASSTTTCCTR